MLVLVLVVLVGLFLNDSVDLCSQIIQQVEGVVLNVVGLIIQQAAVGMYTSYFTGCSQLLSIINCFAHYVTYCAKQRQEYCYMPSVSGPHFLRYRVF
jgi:Na+/serine symporter